MEETAPARITSIDRLRGAVIVLMALDHARDFFQPEGAGPEALDSTTWPFFLTRWVTHFCAPVFVLLAGTSARLVHERARDARATARWLLTRGLWLMFLELTWINLSWFFSYDVVHLGVVWGIGGAMVLLSLVVGLPGPAIGALGLAITLLLAAFGPPDGGPLRFLLWPTWYAKGNPLPLPVSSVYVIVPWFAVMALGWATEPLFRTPRGRTRLLGLGLAALGAFLVLRGLNGFGNPKPWVEHERGLSVTAMSFLNPAKYPPSLHFQLMTLGPALAVVPLLERLRGRPAAILEVYGRVALFFYLLHLPLLHALGRLHAGLRWGTAKPPADSALSLPTIWGAWLLALLILYPLCRRWGELKASRRSPLLRWL